MDRDAAIRAVFEDGWNHQEFGTANEVLAGEYILHVDGASIPLEPSDLESIVQEWHDGFSDFRFEIHAVVSSSDRAALHATLLGTHDGPWSDMAPTGRRVSVEHMFFFRFEADKIVEIWELRDPGEMRSQLRVPEH